MESTDARTATTDACSYLEGSVNRFIQKYQKCFQGTEEEVVKLKKHISKLVQHAQFILKTLTVKRISLKHGVTALYDCWSMAHQTLQKYKDSSLQSILQHFLQCYLRLRDGVTLLVSGECRHPGDIKSIQYKSRLTMNQVCNDGYTMLYSKDLTYSGFGWDEFYDANCGVQARLVKALSTLAGGSFKSKLWDRLVDHGAQLFESSMDTHETELQGIQKSLEDFRERVIGDLAKLLPNRRIIFGTQDKIEYLEICGVFRLQRRGSEFQIMGDEGVLPSGWTIAQWKDHLKLSSRVIVSSNDIDARKRRRISHDSDSDDCNDQKGNLHFLKAKTEEFVSANTTSSVKAIKMDLGVDVTELEKAREFLEAEQQDEVTLMNDTIGDCDISSQRARVERLRKVLQIAVNSNDDPLEIWDVREHLRKETMQLGNDLLSQEGTKNLSDAHQCFKLATALVEEQEVAHDFIVRRTNDNTEGAWLINRNLMLLKGRAQTNSGISLLELSLAPKASHAARKKLRVEAASELILARQCSLRLQSRASDDKKRGASPNEVAFDFIEAVQLEALAWRTYGSVIWHDGKESEAINALENAGSACSKITISEMVYVEQGGDFLREYLKTLVECFFSYTTLFDLIATKLEKGCYNGKSRDSSLLKVTRTCLLTAASKAVDGAKALVRKIESFVSNNPELAVFLDDYGVIREDDLNNALVALRQQSEALADDASASIKRQEKLEIPRSCLGQVLLDSCKGNQITRRFVVADSLGPRRPKNIQRFSNHRDFTYEPRAPEVQITEPDVPMMKWGDQLLIESEMSDKGLLGSYLAFPACAPPLPPEFR